MIDFPPSRSFSPNYSFLLSPTCHTLLCLWLFFRVPFVQVCVKTTARELHSPSPLVLLTLFPLPPPPFVFLECSLGNLDFNPFFHDFRCRYVARFLANELSDVCPLFLVFTCPVAEMRPWRPPPFLLFEFPFFPDLLHMFDALFHIAFLFGRLFFPPQMQDLPMPPLATAVLWFFHFCPG